MDNSNKILIRILFPALSEKYDFLIDPELTVKQAIKEISSEIMEYEKNYDLFSDLSEYRLFYEETDLALEENTELKEYGVVSGSRLMLV